MGNNPLFSLDPAFVEMYRLRKPPFGFNGLGELVYIRTYSRFRDDGTQEQWYQTVERVVNGTYRMQQRHIEQQNLGWDPAMAQESAQEMYDRIWNMKFLPPGRGLWAMGSPLTEERGLFAALSNCAFVSTDNLKKDLAEPFTYLMDASMLGIGVGFDTKGAGQIKIQKIELPSESVESDTYVIPDTREGWVKSLELLLLSYFVPNKKPVVFDYSEVRPAGLPIKGFGGVSSGPEPLCDMHERIRMVLHNRAISSEQSITVTDITDIMNLIGVCVVAGNVRRCLPAGTLVHTDTGLVKIEDVTVGMKAKTSHGYSEISELVHQGVQKVSSVKTQLGEFRATRKHKMAVMNGVGTYEWKHLEDLRSGDRLVFVDSITNGNNTTLPNWSYTKTENSTTCKDITIPELDSGIAWLFGLIHGDGYVYANRKNNGKNAYVSIACDATNSRIIKDATDNLSRFGTTVEAKKRENEECVIVSTTSKQLAWYLDENFKQPNTTIRVPSWILTATPEVRASYVAGVLDADGTQDKPLKVVQSVYPEFVDDMQAVLASLGIPSRKFVSREQKGTWKTQYTLSVVGEKALKAWDNIVAPHSRKYVIKSGRKRSQNDFGYPSDWVSGLSYGRGWSTSSKQMTVATAERSGSGVQTLIPVEVIDITHDVEEIDTFDISVPERNEFVAQEGLLVHNTAEIAFGEHDSEEFMDLKNAEINPERNDPYTGWGWTSNNSILAKIGMNYGPVATRIAINGEPGLAWLSNMQAYSRMGDKPDNKDKKAKGGNPCVVADTWVLTANGPKQVNELIGTPFDAIVDGKPFASQSYGFWKTGTKPVFKVVTKEGLELKLTENHKLKRVSLTEKTRKTEWVETKDLSSGDFISIGNHRGLEWTGNGSYGEGWLVGNLLGDGHFTGNRAVLEYWGADKMFLSDIARDYVATEQIDVRSDFGKITGRTHITHDRISHGSTNLRVLAESFGLTGDKILKNTIEKTSSDFHAGFLRGWFDADGSVQGSTEKGQSIRLSSIGLENLKIAQRMLLRLGINSSLYKNRAAGGYRALPDGNGGTKEYYCQPIHELVISNDNIFVFAERVGFHEPNRASRLAEVLASYKRKPNRERFVAEIEEIVLDGTEDVYDVTIHTVHEFDANGIQAHNCLEQTLESYELCCLVETFPHRHESLEDYLRTLKFAYLYAKTVTLGNTPWAKTNRVLLKNRRIGLSQSGIQQFIAVNGIEEYRKWCEQGFQTVQHYDKVYSDWLAIPRSIKTTSIKPSGSVSLLAGATPGMHWPEDKFYIRRMRLAKTSNLIPTLLAAGYVIEDVLNDPSAVVVEVPVKIEENVRTVKEVSMWEQFAMAAFLQKYWADNQVSSTVTFEPKTEGPQIEFALNYYQYQLKGISLLPRLDYGAFPQMPYESCTEEEYNRRFNKLLPLNFVQTNEEAVSERFCDSSSCMI